MKADLLKPGENVPSEPDLDLYGEWVKSQDPLTGEVVRIWVPYPNDPGTDVNETITLGTINCLARGIVDGGIRVAGTTERFGDTYENIDYVKLWVPASQRITKRDRVTNIRTPDGQVRWRDEEFESIVEGEWEYKATTFNVNGVTPLFDAFNRHVETFVLLERAEFA